MIINILTVAAIVLAPADAFAYLDPGTGSMILQITIAGIAAAGMGLKMYWRRLLGFFRGSPKTDSDNTAV